MGLMDYVKYFDEQDNRNAMKNFASSELPQLLQNDPTGKTAMLRYAQVNPQAVPDVLTAMIDPKAQQARLQQQALMELAGGGGGQQAQPQVQWQSARQEPSQDPMGVMQQAGQVALSPLVQPMQEQPQQAPNDDARRRKLLAFAFPEKYGQLVADEMNPKNRADTAKAEAEVAAPERAKSQINASVSDAQSYLRQLAKDGGITLNSDLKDKSGKTVAESSNLWQRIAIPLATGTGALGRYGSQILDPKTQANRDALLGIRSGQIQLYRAAAGIPAGASNSDKEQEVIGNMLVDPAISYEANMDRLRNFQKTYGKPAPAQQAPSGGGSRVVRFEDLP